MRTKIAIVALTVLMAALARAELKGGSLEGLTEMQIYKVGYDMAAGSPIVILSGKDSQDVMIPIWIGVCEATSIEIGKSGSVTERPLTYDLFAAMVRTMHAKVERVVIVDVRNNIYYAQVEISQGGKHHTIDARPSDAIALAARMGAPIYAKQAVIERSNVSPTAPKKEDI
jgi:bifunctional DNase/RNase